MSDFFKLLGILALIAAMALIGIMSARSLLDQVAKNPTPPPETR